MSKRWARFFQINPRTHTTTMSTKTILALALCDIAAHGIKAGQVIESSEKGLVDSLVKAGDADAAKAAVTYALENGATKVRSAIEAAAEAKVQIEQALRVEVAQLTDLVSKATDGPDKDALAASLAAKASQLEALIA